MWCSPWIVTTRDGSDYDAHVATMAAPETADGTVKAVSQD